MDINAVKITPKKLYRLLSEVLNQSGCVKSNFEIINQMQKTTIVVRLITIELNLIIGFILLFLLVSARLHSLTKLWFQRWLVWLWQCVQCGSAIV